MAKIKYTKNELKKQKDDLKRFRRYLPTLQLKKQQLQMVIRKIEAQIEEKKQAYNQLVLEIKRWVEVFGQIEQLSLNIKGLIQIKEIKLSKGNIAGIDIPVFEGVLFTKIPYDLFSTPLWLDTALEYLEKTIAFKIELSVLEKQAALLKEELRITTQRVNLFEKIKIPEAREIIKKILVFLGDQQTAAVVRGKISKNKIMAAAG